MTQSTLSPIRSVLSHRGAFLTSLAVGAVLMLGVRSLFVGADGSPAMAQAATTVHHHAEPGHDGHGHDPGDVPSASPEDDGHGSHGNESDADSREGDGPEQDAAGEPKTHGGHEADHAKFVPVLLDLGNAACPVMGGDVDGSTFTEWKGLRVGHCCPGCEKRFRKNPESLLDEVSPKWRNAASAAKAIDAAPSDARKALLEKAAKRWTVVRAPVGAKPVAPAGLLVDVGNEACPVMGGDVDGKTFTEWNGLRVGHCCPGCSKRFLASPEALLDEVAPKWRDAAAAVKAVHDAEGTAKATALTKLGKKWKIVRKPGAERSE